MKKFFTTLLGVQCLFGLGLLLGLMPAFAQAPTNGLVAYYPFNGNANDESGHGNNGVVNGATLTTDRFGNANKAYSFDGINNYIELNYSQTNLSSYSISCWVNTLDAGTILQNRGISGNEAYSLTLHLRQNVVEYHLDSSYREIGRECNSTVSDGSWHHIVGTWSSSNGSLITPDQFKIYVDGILTQSQAIDFTCCGYRQNRFANVSGAMKCLIGYYPYWNSHYKGKIDNIYIYNRALSQTEVTQLYNDNNALTTIDIPSDTTWLTPKFVNNAVMPCGAVTTGWNSNPNYDVSCWTTSTQPYPDSVEGISAQSRFVWGRNPWTPFQTAYFRKTFTLSSLPNVTTPYVALRFRADDSGKFYVNGHQVANITWWDQTAVISSAEILPYLVVGTNVLAVEATDLGAVGWWFGSHLHLESINCTFATQITSDVPNNQLTCFTPSTLLTPSVTTGGVAPYTYRWDNGSTDSTRRVHRSGTYAVTITDANGCISNSSIAITSEPNRIELSFLPDTIPLLNCWNESIRIEIPDLTLMRLTEFSYRIWRNGNLLTQGNAPAYPLNRVFRIDAILGGTYDFEFTPMATGCTVTGQIMIRDERNPLNVNDFRITAPSTMLTCTTPTIPLTVVGANGNPLTGYNYAWTSTDFVGQASNLRNITTAGRDSVWVINNATHCRSALPQTIEIQSNTTQPTVAITASNLNFTCGVNNITLTATGATNYLWNDNTTSNVKRISNAGSFSVTGTGANGCTHTANIVIGQTAGVIRGAQVNQTICQGSTLTVGNQTFTSAGDYTIVQTGTLGCDTTYTLHLTVEDSTYRQAISIAAGTSYTIGNSTYSASGTYVHRVASANGCMRTVTTVLTVLPVGVALDTNYRIPNVAIPCQATTFCVDITKNNIVSDTRGWQGIVSYPNHCLQYTGGYKGTALSSGFSDFWVDAAAGQVHYAITPAVGTPIASNGTIAQVCFQLQKNATCAAPYAITAAPVQESYADNARNRFVTVGSSRVTTTTNDTVKVTMVYCGVTLQPFGNLAGAGNAHTEIQSCNPNHIGVMSPNPQGEAICKAGDTIQAVRYPNTDPLTRLSVVNSMDAYRIIQFANHNIVATPTDGMHWVAADVDGNGVVLANDANAALRISVGLDPVKYIWLPTAQVPTTNLNSTIVPIVSNCIPMPSVACAPQAMQIQTIQRGDFVGQAISNSSKLAPLTQSIFMDLTNTRRMGDTVVIPIGYESANLLNAVDLDIMTSNNRLRLLQIETKTTFDQFLSNPTPNLVRSSGFGSNLGGMCLFQLKVLVPAGLSLQESDFSAPRSLLNGVNASFGFKTTAMNCTTGFGEVMPKANVNLYPNPTSNQLTIDYNETVKQLSIVNLLGQSLKTLEINASGRMDVNLSELPQGVYFLRINEKEMLKFVKL
ncbi:MAG: hypothetical protein RLZZ628_2746 [Bacteroidota bacterium]|jgi:hypothetical protein